MKNFATIATALLLLVIAMIVPSPALTWGGEGLPFFTLYGQFVAVAAGFAILLVHTTRKQTLRMGEDAEAIEAIGKVKTGALAAACLAGGFAGARLLYVLFRLDFYVFDVGAAAILRTWEGGFMLYGAALGAILAAAALARAKGVPASLVLDEIAAPGMMMISICRMAEGTATSEGVGVWVENELFCRFPIAVLNEFGEWQLAVFFYEAIAAVAILFVLLRLKAARGETFLTALLLYGGCQIVLESLRMDSCLRIGFVRVSMVISAVAVLAVTLICALRVGKKQAAVSGGVCLALIAAAGVIEWALDKTRVSNLILYPLMMACCAGMIAGGMRFMRKKA